MTNDVAARLAMLREKFVRGGVEKLDQLDETLSRLAAAPDDAVMLDRAMRLFHSFAGSGATYGFPEVSRSAGAAEALCDEIAAGGRGATPPEMASMIDGAAAIRRALVPETADTSAAPPAQRVLVVHQDAEEGAFLKMVLETAGYAVRTCAEMEYAAIDCDTFEPHLLLIGSTAATTLGEAILASLQEGRRTLRIDSLARSSDASAAAPGLSPRTVIRAVIGELDGVP